MTIILFTLATVDLAYNQRMNPFFQVGNENNNGLSYVGSNISTDIVPSLTSTYILQHYQTNYVYAQELIIELAIMGNNAGTGLAKSLSGIDLNGGYNSLLQKVFSFIDTFPPYAAATTLDESYVIFNNTGTGGTGLNQVQSQWSVQTTNLLNEILDSGLSKDQQVLPLVALSILTNSYPFWQDVYYNTGGSNPWYTYITANVSSINDIDWRQVFQANIKGALAGAVFGWINVPENVQGGITIGAMTAGIAAAAQNMENQVNMISVYNP